MIFVARRARLLRNVALTCAVLGILLIADSSNVAVAGSPPDCVPIGGNPGPGGVITAPSGIGQSAAFTTCGTADATSISFSGGSGGSWQSDTLDPNSYANYSLTAIANLTSTSGSFHQIEAGIWVDRIAYGLNKCQYILSYEYFGGPQPPVQTTCVSRKSSVPLTGDILIEPVGGAPVHGTSDSTVVQPISSI